MNPFVHFLAYSGGGCRVKVRWWTYTTDKWIGEIHDATVHLPWEDRRISPPTKEEIQTAVAGYLGCKPEEVYVPPFEE